MIQTRIIIAEDSDVARELYAYLLRQKGYMVFEAPDGQTALDIIQATEEPFHLLISDIRMPRLTGIGLLQALESSGKLPPAVILMSGTPHDLAPLKDRLASFHVQEGGVLEKPINPTVLMQKVAQCTPLPEPQS